QRSSPQTRPWFEPARRHDDRGWLDDRIGDLYHLSGIVAVSRLAGLADRSMGTRGHPHDHGCALLRRARGDVAESGWSVRISARSIWTIHRVPVRLGTVSDHSDRDYRCRRRRFLKLHGRAYKLGLGRLVSDLAARARKTVHGQSAFVQRLRAESVKPAASGSGDDSVSYFRQHSRIADREDHSKHVYVYEDRRAARVDRDRIVSRVESRQRRVHVLVVGAVGERLETLCVAGVV